MSLDVGLAGVIGNWMELRRWRVEILTKLAYPLGGLEKTCGAKRDLTGENCGKMLEVHVLRFISKIFVLCRYAVLSPTNGPPAALNFGARIFLLLNAFGSAEKSTS